MVHLIFILSKEVTWHFFTEVSVWIPISIFNILVVTKSFENKIWIDDKFTIVKKISEILLNLCKTELSLNI